MSSKYDQIFKVVWNLVKEAGAKIAKRNGARQPYFTKSSEIDLVTSTDKEIEDMLISGLADEFSTHKFISEERVKENEPLTNEPTWLIDPVDGTMNFIHGYPHSCISIALLVDKISEIGIVYNPHLNQKFTAIRGKGAFYNDCRICVSGQKKLKNSILLFEMCARDETKLNIILDNLTILSNQVHGIRATGSAALNMSMVALGGADAYFDFGSHHWDVAAGLLFVREAGGVVVDPTGIPYDLMARRILVASSLELAYAISERLTQYYPDPRDK